MLLRRELRKEVGGRGRFMLFDTPADSLALHQPFMNERLPCRSEE
jgi:hypothetical protein